MMGEYFHTFENFQINNTHNINGGLLKPIFKEFGNKYRLDILIDNSQKYNLKFRPFVGDGSEMMRAIMQIDITAKPGKVDYEFNVNEVGQCWFASNEPWLRSIDYETLKDCEYFEMFSRLIVRGAKKVKNRNLPNIVHIIKRSLDNVGKTFMSQRNRYHLI